jgi:hypothetical protein
LAWSISCTITIDQGEDVAGWWFPNLNRPKAGVAWRGPNGHSLDVGVCWTALDNPEPDKQIKEIVLRGPLNQGEWIVAGITLADQEHPVKKSMETFGGPDNWPPASCTFGLLEGLAGVHDASASMERIVLSPRWTAAGVEDIKVNARYAGWPGYVSYRFRWLVDDKKIILDAASSSEKARVRVLLPRSAGSNVMVQVNGVAVPVELEVVGESRYAAFDIPGSGASSAVVAW